MGEHEQTDRENVVNLDARRPVPAARQLSDFAIESVGDELVIFDAETLQYHTLNATALRIWRACNGAASPASIAEDLGIPVELVESTVAELGEAGLLVESGDRWDANVTRRRAAKLIAAGLVGAVGLPVIKSITAPDAASAETPGQCESAGAFYGPCSVFNPGDQTACFNACQGAGFCGGLCVSIAPPITDGCCFCGGDFCD